MCAAVCVCIIERKRERERDIYTPAVLGRSFLFVVEMVAAAGLSVCCWTRAAFADSPDVYLYTHAVCVCVRWCAVGYLFVK
jgi:hypothetical protein